MDPLLKRIEEEGLHLSADRGAQGRLRAIASAFRVSGP